MPTRLNQRPRPRQRNSRICNGGDRGTRNRLASGDNPEEPIKTQKFRPIRFDKSNVWTNQILNKIRPRVSTGQQLWNNFCKKSNNFAGQGFLMVWPAFNTLIRTKIPFKTWVRCVLNVNLFFCVFTYQMCLNIVFVIIFIDFDTVFWYFCNMLYKQVHSHSHSQKYELRTTSAACMVQKTYLFAWSCIKLFLQIVF